MFLLYIDATNNTSQHLAVFDNPMPGSFKKGDIVTLKHNHHVVYTNYSGLSVHASNVESLKNKTYNMKCHDAFLRSIGHKYLYTF